MTKHTGFTLTSLRPPDPEVSCCDGTVFRLPAKISACGPAQLSVLQQLTGNRTFPADSVQYTIKQLPCQNRSLVHRVVASAGGVRITPFFSAFSAARLKQPFSVTNFFDLYFHHFHWITKNHISLLQTLMTLFFQVGNIRSRIDPPNASCWPASDCGPEANPLRLMKDRQTGLMKNFPEQSGKVIRDRA